MKLRHWNIREPRNILAYCRDTSCGNVLRRCEQFIKRRIMLQYHVRSKSMDAITECDKLSYIISGYIGLLGQWDIVFSCRHATVVFRKNRPVSEEMSIKPFCPSRCEALAEMPDPAFQEQHFALMYLVIRITFSYIHNTFDYANHYIKIAYAIHMPKWRCSSQHRTVGQQWHESRVD